MRQETLDLIKRFEGCRLRAYQDSAGVWTIGYGSTRSVAPGLEITQAEADSRLLRDAKSAERAVARLITVPLTENQLTALTDFTFNLGAGVLQASTLRRRLNRGEYSSIPAELRRWVHAGGIKLSGLVKRRDLEARLFAG